MWVSVSQPLTFYLNAYEIRPQVPSNPLEAFRIAPNIDAETAKHLSFVLRENNLVFHRQLSDYYEYKAGYYIYDVEKWSEIINSNEILSKLEHHKESVEATSYVVRSAILKLIENKLKAIEGLRKVRSQSIDERKFYFSQDLLKDKSVIFGYYRCFVYRVEYIHKPTKKLLLLILPSVLVVGKESLEGLIKKRKLPSELLLGLPFKVLYENDQNAKIGTYTGFLENITGDVATVRLADLSITKINVPLRNLYAIGRIDLYRKVVEFLGEDYDLLYDYKGKLTFAWEKGKKMEDAPLKMKEVTENIHKEIFAKKVFPLELQETIYTISNDPVSPEIVED